MILPEILLLLLTVTFSRVSMSCSAQAAAELVNDFMIEKCPL